MAALKYSRQREAIKNYLCSTTTHPTADMIYENIRLVFPKISLGTVYRNLNLLVEHGEISKISCGDGCDRFDRNPLPHNHFICTECHAVLDLEMENFDHINALANANFDGKIQGHMTYFFGKCPKCYHPTMKK